MKVNMTLADGRDCLFQYDESAFLFVSGCREVHFCHEGDDESIVVPVVLHDHAADDLSSLPAYGCGHGHFGKVGHVLVPASLLKRAEDIIAYGAGLDNTFCRFVFHVEGRPSIGRRETPRPGRCEDGEED